jgi:hypothetical protein
MTNICRFRLLSGRATLLGSAILSVFALTGCDALWGGFVKEGPLTCVDTGCSTSQVCNQSSGLCEVTTQPPTPLVPLMFKDLSPKFMPMAGGPIEISGSGLTADTRVTIDASAVTGVTTNPELTQLKGTAPKAQKVCVPLPLRLQRGSDFPIVIPAAFTYRFEPFTVQPWLAFNGVTSKVSQLLPAQMDADNRLDLVVHHPLGFRVYYGPDGAGNANIAPGSSPAAYEKIRVGKLTGSQNTDVITIQGKTLTVEACQPGSGVQGTCSPKGRYDASGLIRDAFAMDALTDPNEELVMVIADPGVPGTINVAPVSNPTITKRTSLLTGTEIYAASSGDMNLDGKADTLFLVIPNALAVSAVTPVGGLQWPPQLISGTPDGLEAPITGNIDGDAVADVVAYAASKSSLYVLLGKSSLTQLNRYSIPIPPAMQTSPAGMDLQIYDVNCDGAGDIILSGHDAAYGPYVFLNNGQGEFTAPPTLISVVNFQPTQGGPFAVMDLNRDGLPDLILRPAFGASGLNIGLGVVP